MRTEDMKAWPTWGAQTSPQFPIGFDAEDEFCECDLEPTEHEAAGNKCANCGKLLG